MNQASAKKEAMEEKLQDLAIELLPTKTLTPHPDNEALWATKDKDIEALAKTVKKTKVIDPLLVHESLSGTVVLSGHSRLAVAEKLGIKKVPCRKVSGLSETEQLLWIIAFNTGHATDKKRLLKAALYCAEKNKDIDVLAMLDFCGAGEDAERWAEAIDKAIGVVSTSGKNKSRAAKTVQKAAEAGIDALEASVKKSEEIKGTISASEHLSSLGFSEQKPNPEEDLQEKTPPKTCEETEPKASEAVSLGPEATEETEIIPENPEPAKPAGMPSDLEAGAKWLNRKMYEAGMHDNLQVEFSMKTVLAATAGNELPDAPSKAVIAGLNKKVADWMEVARTNILEYEAAIEDVNAVFKKWMARPVNGQVMVPAHAISEPFIKRGLETMKNMDPEVLASQEEAQ